ncbi:hypothetical protein [Tannerella serpentiformis]|uniref:hypothetical protein n=1 Tax=Tannerella serpentiformis TaxID=712710 RepID=UPI00131D8AE6|nr:hypothetical protein [Tannerella serpentiformis]
MERSHLKDGVNEEVSRNDSLTRYKQAYNDFSQSKMLPETNHFGKEQSTFPSILRITFQQVITWLGALGGGVGGMKRAYLRGSEDIKS